MATSTQKDAQHHQPSEKRKLKPRRDTPQNPAGQLESKSQTSSAGENVDKLEQQYIFGDDVKYGR